MSIKPEYADKIFAGSKRYEFRRVIFKSQRVSKVVVYASSPIQRVIGEFEVDEILASSKEGLWRKTKRYSGITKTHFDQYFSDKQMAYAIKIKRAQRYKLPKRLEQVTHAGCPPQSFAYLPALSRLTVET